MMLGREPVTYATPMKEVEELRRFAPASRRRARSRLGHSWSRAGCALRKRLLQLTNPHERFPTLVLDGGPQAWPLREERGFLGTRRARECVTGYLRLGSRITNSRFCRWAVRSFAIIAVALRAPMPRARTAARRDSDLLQDARARSASVSGESLD